MKPSFKAVIFDMDGVITDTMPYHMRAWRKTFADQGIAVSDIDIYRREGQKGLESVREIFAQHGRVFSWAVAQKMLADKEVCFKKIVHKKYIPGVRALIRRLLRQGTRLAIVTGTSRHEMERLLPVAFRSHFEVVVTGSDVRRGKPDPEPYRKALKALGLKGSEAVVVENAPFGILSATRAGLRCYALATSLPSEYLVGATCIFNGHRDLGDHLLAKGI